MMRFRNKWCTKMGRKIAGAPGPRTKLLLCSRAGQAPRSLSNVLACYQRPVHRVTAMLDPKLFDDLSRRVAGSLPPGLQSLQGDLQRNLRSAIESALAKMNLVTREEFEVQQAVLLRTREKLKALEARVAALEAATKD